MRNRKIALFYTSIEPIHRETHAHYGLKNTNSPFSFASDVNTAPISQNELSQVAAYYPIIFVGDELTPVAALSIEDSSNSFVNKNGTWLGKTYIPMSVRRYPFIMVKPEQSKESILAFDSSSDFVTKESPDFPFFEEGSPSLLMKKSIELCHAFEQGLSRIKNAIAKLNDLDLFCTKVFSYKDKLGDTQKIQFTGLNDDLIQELSSDDFLALRETEALDLIYAHRFSLNAWQKLVELHEQK